MSKSIRLGLYVGVAALAIGCGSAEEQRLEIQGTVTLDGKPLSEGQIRFFPLTNGVGAYGPVTNGAYAITEDEGITPGTYRVEISREKSTGRKMSNPDNPEEMIDEVIETIPKQYNLNSQLTIEIKPDSNPSFDFDLKSKS